MEELLSPRIFCTFASAANLTPAERVTSRNRTEGARAKFTGELNILERLISHPLLVLDIDFVVRPDSRAGTGGRCDEYIGCDGVQFAAARVD